MTTKPAGRARALFATVAAMAIIALFGALALIATHGPRAVQTPASTPGTLKGQWQTLDRLTIHTWTNKAGDPQVAPTNPQVVYETYNSTNSFAMYSPGIKRTDDGGKTWHTLTLPLKGDHIKGIYAAVSPLDAQTVFLSLYSDGLTGCPAKDIVSDYALCLQVFVSQDAGKTWKPTITPETGYADGFNISNISTASAQGQTLFDSAGCISSQCERILKSDDGGVTWTLADAQLAASNQMLCNYAAASTGTTLFAATAEKGTDCGYARTATANLWRSDDAGAHWSQVSTLPSAAVNGMLVASRGAGQQPLVYIYLPRVSATKTKMNTPMYVDSADALQVSADGGQHWASAPLLGIAESQIPYFHPFGTLSDGSIIMPFTAPGTNAGMDVSIYAWRAGDSGWHRLTNGSGYGYINDLVLSSVNGKETLWLTANSGSPTDTDKDAYRVLRCDL